jgi:N utilization substance protein A
VDPVGACVGLKGSRVQAVVSELSGERIDIVPWHLDPEVFARRALAPARVAKVLSDSERHVITAIVDEDQLSLAIGRNGQNVRLASQLIGWQIDLYSSKDWLARGAESSLFGGGDEYEVSDFPLSELEGISAQTLAALEAADINTFFEAIEMERDEFVAIPGIDEGDADRLMELIDELTVVDEATEPGAEAASDREAVADPEAEAAPEAEIEDEAEDETEDEADSETEPESEAVAVSGETEEDDAALS